MEGLREGYEFYAKNSAAFTGADQAHEWVEGIDEAIDALQSGLEEFAGKNTPVDSLGGQVAETWHAGTFNIDAAIKESSDRATRLESTDLGSVDVKLDSGAEYSLKYNKNAGTSLKEQAKTFGEKARGGSADAAKAIETGEAAEGDLLYREQQRLIPSDQLDEAKKAAFRKEAKERANRPEQADRYKKAGEKLTDRVSNEEGVESKPLTKQESRELARDASASEIDLEEYGISKQQLVEFEHVMKKSLKAGMSAAAVAAALAAAPALLEAVEYLVKTGEIDTDKLSDAGMDALGGGAKGFVIGASCAAIIGLAETGAFGKAVENIEPSVVGAAAVVIVSTVINGYKVAAGKMHPAEMTEALVRDSLVATASVALGAAGKALGGAIAKEIASKAVGTIFQIMLPQLPAVGYLIGSFVGSAAAGLAFAAGKQAFVALCVESGFTAFGLVDQDYELPESALREIGADVLEYEAIVPEAAEPERVSFETVSPDTAVPEGIELTFVRRGVVGVAKVGYVA